MPPPRRPEGVNVLRDLKEWKGIGLRMMFGGSWNVAGSPNQVIAQVSEMYSFLGGCGKL
jgi:hypothetical protein